MDNKLYVTDSGNYVYEMVGYEIPVPFWDPDTDLVETVIFQHTLHSRTRASQRCIDQERIDIVMVYGETVYKQGLIYVYLGRDQVPDHLARHRDKYANTVLVLSGDSNQVITCYRCHNPAKHIRRKQKSLAVCSRAA